MSLMGREGPPPTDAWEGLREWARQSWWQRYRISLLAVTPINTLVFAFAAVALLVAETSWRSAALIAGLWVVCVPLTALGYLRRIGRSAAKVPPISPASLNPTTAVDIRGNRERE